jgi:hypothetical protein
MMEAVRTFETSVHSNETTRRYNPEGSKLHVGVYFFRLGTACQTFPALSLVEFTNEYFDD